MEGKRWLPLFSFLLLSLLIVDVYSLEAENIVGGQLATRGQFSYHVSIEVFGTSVCGGAIVSKFHVVTAAHCVIDKSKSEFQKYPFKVVGATLDINKKDSTSQGIFVEKLYVPTKYIKTLKSGHPTGDIAVLKLKEPFNLEGNPYLTNVALPDKSWNLYNKTAIVTGYGYNWVKVEKDAASGKIEEIDGGSNGKLRFAKAIVLANSVCQKNYKWTITDDHVCARVEQNDMSKSGIVTAPRGVCSGDSGGPLVYSSRILIGVVSSSPTGCRENIAAGVYTRVASFLTFLRKAIWDQNDPEVLSKLVMTRTSYFDD